MHILELDENKRIMASYEALPKGIERGTYEGKVIVDKLPEDENEDIRNYLYIDDEYVYDPLSEPEPIDPEPAGEYATYDEMADAIREGVNSYNG